MPPLEEAPGWVPNRTNITQQDYNIIIDPSMGGEFTLGVGVEMNDPDCPVVRFSPFKHPPTWTLAQDLGTLDDSDIHQTFFHLEKRETIEEEARFIFAELKLKYNFASLKAAYEHVVNERKTSKSMYFKFTHQKTSPGITPDRLIWSVTPPSELDDPKINDDARYFKTISMYGSHYVAFIIYGFSLIVQATLNTTSSNEVERFSAAFSAWGSGGSLSLEHRQSLQSSSVSVTGIIKSGAITSKDGTTGIPDVIIKDFESIMTFIENYQARKFVIARAPIYAHLSSYYNTFSSFPISSLLWTPKTGSLPTSNFGVPKGTIVAWFMNGPLPDGWVICDGSYGTPDLKRKFIRGAEAPSTALVTGGSEEHYHSGTIITPGQDAGEDRGGGRDAAHRWHTHGVTINNSAHLPPFVDIVYIMKT